MNTPDSIKFTVSALVLAPPLPKTEVAIQPILSCVRRALSLTGDADSSGNLNPTGFVPRGRWDSACAVAREFLISLIPSRPAPTRTLTQLELQLA